MPGKNKTPLIGWHSEDPTLKGWIKDQASCAGVTVREYLDRVLAAHQKTVRAEQEREEGQ